MNGIIVVDKPSGWTSHDVVAKLRGALKTKRVGHSGTLDPIATGVLPVFAGRATRAVGFCESAEKEYIAGMRTGIITDTQDITGAVTRTFETSATAEDLLGVLPRFLGPQKQIPPMYSAIKQGGRKLYELARRGIEVQRAERDVSIFEIELLGSGDGEFMLRIVCSKGTYIRTLCNDIGEVLGCGAVMSSLRRTRAGAFTIGMASSLETVLDAVSQGKPEDILLPTDTVFSEFPAISLGEAHTEKCRHGASFPLALQTDGKYRFYAPDGEFLMLGEVRGGTVGTIKSFFEPGVPGAGSQEPGV